MPTLFSRHFSRTKLAIAGKQLLLGASIPLTLMSLSSSAYSADEQLEPWQQAQKTEVWEPVPPVVSAPVGAPPSDAVVLFDGKNLAQWESVKGSKAAWTVRNGVLTVKPGAGDIRSTSDFCDVQLHMEWRTPPAPESVQGQDRNNSGVFFQERYEVQILDSYQNETYPNGQAAAIYKQHIPLANATRPPNEWQTYDIIFRAPRFDSSGELTAPAYITVLHNGVLVQNHAEVQGTTVWIGEPEYEAHGCAPISLQDHSNPVSFRNIWVREL